MLLLRGSLSHHVAQAWELGTVPDSSDKVPMRHRVVAILYLGCGPAPPTSIFNSSLDHGSLLAGLPASGLPLPDHSLLCSLSELSNMPIRWTHSFACHFSTALHHPQEDQGRVLPDRARGSLPGTLAFVSRGCPALPAPLSSTASLSHTELLSIPPRNYSLPEQSSPRLSLPPPPPSLGQFSTDPLGSGLPSVPPGSCACPPTLSWISRSPCTRPPNRACPAPPCVPGW